MQRLVRRGPVAHVPSPSVLVHRATGFLIPTYGSSDIRGQSLSNAFFWAISRSQDLTLLHGCVRARRASQRQRFEQLVHDAALTSVGQGTGAGGFVVPRRNIQAPLGIEARMAALDLPLFGNIVLCAILVSAAYTFSVALVAGRGRLHLLPAVRSGVYGTVGLIALAVCTLAYAFQSHDFRIRYVLRYSDRSMEWFYLVASLWGGQDGSILWWCFRMAFTLSRL